jgi:hypothetical protein
VKCKKQIVNGMLVLTVSLLANFVLNWDFQDLVLAVYSIRISFHLSPVSIAPKSTLDQAKHHHHLKLIEDS